MVKILLQIIVVVVIVVVVIVGAVVVEGFVVTFMIVVVVFNSISCKFIFCWVHCDIFIVIGKLEMIQIVVVTI